MYLNTYIIVIKHRFKVETYISNNNNVEHYCLLIVITYCIQEDFTVFSMNTLYFYVNVLHYIVCIPVTIVYIYIKYNISPTVLL